MITGDHKRTPSTRYHVPKVQCTACPWMGERVYVVPGEERGNREAGWGPCPRCGQALKRRSVGRHIVRSGPERPRS